MQIVFGYRSIGRAYAMRIFRYGVPVSDPLRAPALLTRADAQSGICLSEANYAVQRPNALAGKAGIISKETRTGGAGARTCFGNAVVLPVRLSQQ